MTDPAQLADLAINQPDVALIFEGGGMRNSYTAPMVVELLARNLNFGCVYGISAGLAAKVSQSKARGSPAGAFSISSS